MSSSIQHQTRVHRLRRLWWEVQSWSQATFGDTWKRGPLGPIRHLKKEAAEAEANPHDIRELADCLILVFDAAWRAGFTYSQLADAALEKMITNRQRQWPASAVGGDQPIEHIRGGAE